MTDPCGYIGMSRTLACRHAPCRLTAGHCLALSIHDLLASAILTLGSTFAVVGVMTPDHAEPATFSSSSAGPGPYRG